jgi:predicted ATPase
MSPANPYTKALDGLELPDPVAAFFRFCRAREAVRLARASGAPPPWSDDPILQRGRFLNVFREDDRSSQALMRFVAPVIDDLPLLIQALFFARWCNRSETLDALDVTLLNDPVALRHALERLPVQPWCNVTAYPVEPVTWQGQRISRLDTATRLFAEIKGDLTATIIAANGRVTTATRSVNALFGMANDFPIFMAVMDVAWFRPEVIDPASHVPTGIGAEPYMDRLADFLGLSSHQEVAEQMIDLQAAHWPEAKRAFQPIDIEYLACECRKYFSYVTGSKTFTGKNQFLPGETPSFTFDVPATAAEGSVVDTQIQVIAGGPCSGKTTLLRALEEAGYHIVFETAQHLLDAGLARGQSAEELRMDPVAWQRQVLEADFACFENLSTTALVFTDTSFVEDLVFGERAGISLGPNTMRWLQRKRYGRVFFLEPLEAYEQTASRLETRDVAAAISCEVRQRYQTLGYDLITVPSGSLEQRMATILDAVEGAV